MAVSVCEVEKNKKQHSECTVQIPTFKQVIDTHGNRTHVVDSTGDYVRFYADARKVLYT